MVKQIIDDTRVGFRFPKNTRLDFVKKALKDSNNLCDEIIRHDGNWILLCYDNIDNGFYHGCIELLSKYKKTPVVVHSRFRLVGVTKVTLDKDD